jgi:outer membrane protein OmpA-like peptidoglycan-associated protein
MNAHSKIKLVAAPLASVLLLFSVGCAREAKKEAAAPAPPSYSVTMTTAAEEAKPISPSLAVSEEIAEACDLHFASIERAPKFEFDKSELLAADHDVLDRIAACVTTGPLTGRELHLVGRADPRGSEQYNFALGARRAASVSGYLAPLGVEPARLHHTSRGKLDATGTDELTWQIDRRVDILLVH